MLSLTSLLNPDPPGPSPSGTRFRPSPPSPIHTPSSYLRNAQVESSSMERHIMAKHKSIRDPKSKAKGHVRFLPYEDLDEKSHREVCKFQVAPYGGILETCKHIPYNSGKKDFFEKTGRESFEVFHYSFKQPGDGTDYCVMWDYNTGLVRMTPFFKCCKYGKTMPAKMLNLNPGLRDITHSITGGSIQAQGYWMPFSCARAVCATFCHKIAGALIPIFGPGFPAECVPTDSPDHGRMIIDPAIVAEAARQAASFRRMYMENHEHHHHHQQQQQPHQHRHQSQPRHHQHHHRVAGGGSSPKHHHHHHHHDAYDYRGLGPPDGSPYGTDTDGEGPEGGRYMVGIPPLRNHAGAAAAAAAAAAGGGWTAANHDHSHHQQQQRQPPYRDEAFGANPLLSAVPRWAAVSPTVHHHHLPPAVPPPPPPPPPPPYPHSYPPQPYYQQHHQHQHQQHQQQHAAINTPAAYQPQQPQNHHRLPSVQPLWATTKRSAPPEAEAADYEYDGGESSQSGSSSSPAATSRGDSAVAYDELPSLAASASAAVAAAAATTGSQNATEKNAALLLIGLSVRDRRDGSYSPAAGELPPLPSMVETTHRSKRQRATSY